MEPEYAGTELPSLMYQVLTERRVEGRRETDILEDHSLGQLMPEAGGLETTHVILSYGKLPR